MPPPQASGKRREFDPLEVNFVCYLKYLIRGGARWIRTRDISPLAKCAATTALSRELNLAGRRLESPIRTQAAVAARHVRKASVRRVRSVRRDVR